MTIRAAFMKILLQEDLNFLLTNRLPRRLATRVVGRLARIEHPLVARPAIASWRFFSGADLSDAAAPRFDSLRDAFVRALRPGARPADPDPATIVSPCDAIVGAHGAIGAGGGVYQAKGFPYALADLIPDPALIERVRGGSFVTLRLTAGMYHRFHAPHDLRIDGVTYLSGDCWNVNPIALARVARLFCRNERAVIEARLADGTPLVIVAVAAILVASIRLTFLDTVRTLRERGPGRTGCDAALVKGAEMGWFEHGSTILVFLPAGVRLDDDLAEGGAIRCGAALARMAPSEARDSR